jgi:hypothetical protein
MSDELKWQLKTLFDDILTEISAEAAQNILVQSF